MTDVVYILADKNKRGSEKELKLSLRSLEKNAKNLGNIYIVTDELPEWLCNVEHIKAEDIYKKETNIFYKLLTACKNIKSDEFLYFNDDFFMLKPFDSDKYPYFYIGTVATINNPSRWQMVQNRTVCALEKEGIDIVIDYKGHCPLRINRKNFLKLERFFDESKDKPVGYEIRVLYGNLFIKDAILAKDTKLWSNDVICDNLQGCVSTKDEADDILLQLEKMFNEKSRFEK